MDLMVMSEKELEDLRKQANELWLKLQKRGKCELEYQNRIEAVPATFNFEFSVLTVLISIEKLLKLLRSDNSNNQTQCVFSIHIERKY